MLCTHWVYDAAHVRLLCLLFLLKHSFHTQTRYKDSMVMKNLAVCLYACCKSYLNADHLHQVLLSLVSAAPLDPAQYSATSLTWRASVARVLYTASSEYKLNDLHMTNEDEEKWWACVFQSRRAAGIVEICAGPSVMGHSRYVGKQEEYRRLDRRSPGLRDR